MKLIWGGLVVWLASGRGFCSPDSYDRLSRHPICIICVRASHFLSPTLKALSSMNPIHKGSTEQSQSQRTLVTQQDWQGLVQST